jgi:hypothetical protein
MSDRGVIVYLHARPATVETFCGGIRTRFKRSFTGQNDAAIKSLVIMG